jgi:hypothetical protein
MNFEVMYENHHVPGTYLQSRDICYCVEIGMANKLRTDCGVFLIHNSTACIALFKIRLRSVTKDQLPLVNFYCTRLEGPNPMRWSVTRGEKSWLSLLRCTEYSLTITESKAWWIFPKNGKETVGRIYDFHFPSYLNIFLNSLLAITTILDSFRSPFHF